MDPIARRILELYDQLERDTLDLHTLFEMVGGNPPAQREAVLDRVSEMTKSGLLCEDRRSDFYMRTEDGRLAVVGPRTITIYTREGCHLCEEAKSIILPLLSKYGATLREVDIDDDRTLLDRYTNDVPVVFLGAHKIAEHRVDPASLRRALEQAKN
ncbi:MAG TPA: glutaredoxin family protein [Candidatus Limnocylindrales bacterium]|nr:glutaredoxin family protein [Candidatus Limnocylindrales bacterium]